MRRTFYLTQSILSVFFLVSFLILSMPRLAFANEHIGKSGPVSRFFSQLFSKAEKVCEPCLIQFIRDEKGFFQEIGGERYLIYLSEGQDGTQAGEAVIKVNGRCEPVHPFVADSLERHYRLTPFNEKQNAEITEFLRLQDQKRVEQIRQFAETGRFPVEKIEYVQEPNQKRKLGIRLFPSTHARGLRTSWAAQNCVGCHTGKKAEVFPHYVYDLSYWQQALDSSDASTRADAIRWLERFNQVLINTPSMPPNGTHEAKNFVSSARKNEILQFLKRNSNLVRTQVQAQEVPMATENAGLSTKEPLLLTDPKYSESYREVLSTVRTEDPFLKDLLTSYDLLYDKTGVPDASQAPNEQNGNAISLGVRPLSYPVSNRDVVGKVIDENDDWLPPFDTGFGLSKAAGSVGTFFLARRPYQEGTQEKAPIGTYSELYYSVNDFNKSTQNRLDPDTTQSWRWIYPNKMVLSEVAFKNIESDLGKTVSFVFEIRTREKVHSELHTPRVFWRGEAYRSFPTPESLVEAVKSMPDWQNNEGLTEIVRRIESGDIGVETQLANHFGNIFKEDGKLKNTLKGIRFDLPKSLDKKTAQALFLGKPLKPTRGLKPWAISGYPFPDNYNGGAVQVTIESCTNCHRHAGQKFSDFFTMGGFPTEYYSSTDEYGNMGGDDGAPSLHFFDLEEMKKWGVHTGTRDNPDNRKWRDVFVQTGWLKALKDLPREDYIQTNERLPIQ